MLERGLHREVPLRRGLKRRYEEPLEPLRRPWAIGQRPALLHFGEQAVRLEPVALQVFQEERVDFFLRLAAQDAGAPAGEGERSGQPRSSPQLPSGAPSFGDPRLT
jgi:hypothetical protein